MLRRSPGFSAVVIVTLAIGIGLNTAVFSVVDAVLLRPPAFAHPERVLWLTTLDPRIKDEFVTSHDFQAWREATSLEQPRRVRRVRWSSHRRRHLRARADRDGFRRLLGDGRRAAGLGPSACGRPI